MTEDHDDRRRAGAERVVTDTARGTRRVHRDGTRGHHRIERADGSVLRVHRDERARSVRVHDDAGPLLSLAAEGDTVVGVDRHGTTRAWRVGTSTRVARDDGDRRSVLRVDRDEAGRPRRVTVPGSDADLHYRRDPDGTWAVTDDAGRTVVRIVPDGRSTTTEVDGWGWTEHAAPGRVALATTTGEPLGATLLDRGGRVVGRVDVDGGTHGYERDGDGRLVRWTRTGAGEDHEVVWAFTAAVLGDDGTPDRPASIRSVTTDGRRRRWRTDEGGRVTAVLGGDRTVRYDHDAAGKRTARRTRSGTTTYTTDALGQVTGITHPDGRRTVMAWDALGRRVLVERDGRRHHEHRDLDGRLWAVTDDDGVARHVFVWWEGRVVARIDGPVGTPVAEAYVTDPHGTLLAVASPHEDGWRVTNTVGDPYGVVTGPWRPTLFGHISDVDDQLVCAGARLYDPATAGFLTPDPWHAGDDDPRVLGGADPAVLARLREAPLAGIHPYALSQFDPVDRPDVDGHFAWGNFFLTLFLAPTWGFPLTSMSIFLFLPLDIYIELVGLLVFIFTDHPWPQHSLVNMKGASGSSRLGTASLSLNGFLPRVIAGGGVDSDRAITIGHVVWANRRYFELLDRPRVLSIQDISGPPDPASGRPAGGDTVFSRTAAGSIVVVDGTDADNRRWLHASWWTRGAGTHVGERGTNVQVFEDRAEPGEAHTTGTIHLAQPMPEAMATPRTADDEGTLRVTEYPVTRQSTGRLVTDQAFAVAVPADAGLGIDAVVRVRGDDDEVAPAFAVVSDLLDGVDPILLLDTTLPARLGREGLRVAAVTTASGSSAAVSDGWTLPAAGPDTPERRTLRRAGAPDGRVRVGDVLAITPTPTAPPGRPVVHGLVESLRVTLTLDAAPPPGSEGATLVPLRLEGTVARGSVPDRAADPTRITITGDHDFEVDDLVTVLPTGGTPHHARVTATTDAVDGAPASIEVSPGATAATAPDAPTPVRVARLVVGDAERDGVAVEAVDGDEVTVATRSTGLYPVDSPVLLQQDDAREVRRVAAVGDATLVLVDELAPAGPLGPDVAIRRMAVADDEHDGRLAADRFVRFLTGTRPTDYGEFPDEVMGLVPDSYDDEREPEGWRFFVRSSTGIAGLHPDFPDHWQPFTHAGVDYWLVTSPLRTVEDGDRLDWEPDPDDTFPRRHRQNLMTGTPAPNLEVKVRGFARAGTPVVRPLPHGDPVLCRPLETLVPDEPQVRWSLADSLDEHELMHTLQNTFWGPLLGALPLQGLFRTVADTFAAAGTERPEWMVWTFNDDEDRAFGDLNVFEIVSMAGFMQLAWTLMLAPARFFDGVPAHLDSLSAADWGQVVNPVNQQILNHVPEVDPDAEAGERWGLYVANLLARSLDLRSWTPLIGLVPLLLPDGPTNFIEQQAARASGDIYSTLLTVDDRSNRNLRLRLGNALLAEKRDGDQTLPLGGSARVMVFYGATSRWQPLDRCDAPTELVHYQVDVGGRWAWNAPLTTIATPGAGTLLPVDLYARVGGTATTLVVEGPAADPTDPGTPLAPRPTMEVHVAGANDTFHPRPRALVPAGPAVSRAFGFYLVPASEGALVLTAHDGNAADADKDPFTSRATVTVAGAVRVDEQPVAWTAPLPIGDPGPPLAPATGDVSRARTQRAQLVVDGQDTSDWAIEVGPGLTATPRPGGQGWTLAFGDPGTGFPGRARVRIWRPLRPDDEELFDHTTRDEPTHDGIRSYLDGTAWLPVRDFSVEVTDLPTLPDATFDAHEEHVRDLPVAVAGAASIVVTPAGGRTLVHEPTGEGEANRQWRFALAGRRAVQETLTFPVRVTFGTGPDAVERTFELTVQPSLTLDTDPPGGPYEVPRAGGRLELVVGGGTAPFTVDGALPAGVTATVSGSTVTVQASVPAPTGALAVAVRDADDHLATRTVTIVPGGPAGGPAQRADAWDLAESTPGPWDPITEAYARAILVMQSRPADDPTSWTFQAALHGSYAAPPPGVERWSPGNPDGAWASCQHASWYFLPWHRMYIHYFERIVRAAVVDAGGTAEWALPYWDYDSPTPRNMLPPAFREPTLPDGATPNPLAPAGRRVPAFQQGIAGIRPEHASSADAMRERRFSGDSGGVAFGGARLAPNHFGGGGWGLLEQQPHNIVHGLIGGRPSDTSSCSGTYMADGNCAALDPIFWLHHANIDRLWGVWLAQGGGRANPSDPDWRDRSFTFYDESGTAVSLTCADVGTTAQLDYEYV